VRQDREKELISRLAVVQKLTLAETMEMLGISESTARRLFARLEQDGHAIRLHGGIQATGSVKTRYSFECGVRTNILRKKAIARKAVQYLQDGDVVFCDSGTTMQCFCAELINRLQQDKLQIKVYTNSLANLELLSPHVQVHLVGGVYRENRKDFCGYLTEQALSGLFFTKSFVGADGCVEDRFTTTDFDTAKMNQVAMQNSEQTFMLADSSKFGSASHVAYVHAEQLHTIVTDSDLPAEIRVHLQKYKTQLICVDPEQ